MRKKYSNDREKLLKFKAEGRKFGNILRSLEQFIKTVKGQNTLLTCFWMFLIFNQSIRKMWDTRDFKRYL